jgi:hypothetical protein
MLVSLPLHIDIPMIHSALVCEQKHIFAAYSWQVLKASKIPGSLRVRVRVVQPQLGFWRNWHGVGGWGCRPVKALMTEKTNLSTVRLIERLGQKP